jgi:hypothetical protein
VILASIGSDGATVRSHARGRHSNNGGGQCILWSECAGEAPSTAYGVSGLCFGPAPVPGLDGGKTGLAAIAGVYHQGQGTRPIINFSGDSERGTARAGQITESVIRSGKARGVREFVSLLAGFLLCRGRGACIGFFEAI